MQKKRFWNSLEFVLIIFLLFQLVGPRNISYPDQFTKVERMVSAKIFDFVGWTVDAAKLKLTQNSIQQLDFLTIDQQQQLVKEYIELIADIKSHEYQLDILYADPTIKDVAQSTKIVRDQLADLYQTRNLVGPIAESILQEMLGSVMDELGFTVGGQMFPPVMYHSTPLPWALIVSPREVIQQDVHISLQTDLTIEQRISIEEAISEKLDVSALIVPVGGIGTYPTMVAESSNFNWLVEVISHEWMHNYLTLRPLGILYNKTSQIRTMNETTASIVGTEAGELLITSFFPEFVPLPPKPIEEIENDILEETQPEELDSSLPPVFDFRAEMRETRVTVDALLADGKIEEAEAYMNERQQVFWNNGYAIRKINQAYFAFHGAYADVPGGAAGEDPVGAAVRTLRKTSDSLYEFVSTIAWMFSFDDLIEEVATP
jgi:hypothetical protein